MQLVAYQVDGGFNFPFDRCSLVFEERELAVYAGSQTECAVVETIINAERDFDDAYELVCRFLNALAFENRTGYEIINVSSQALSERPALPLRRPSSSWPRNFRSEAHFTTLRSPQSKPARLALAIYSEALSSKSPFLTFLSLWRILDIRYENRPVHGAKNWINHAIQEGYNIGLEAELMKMVERGDNVGQYFAEQCRNAIAHVEKPTHLKSYRWPDRHQIYRAVHAIRSFVDYFIREELGMPRYRERVEVLRVVNSTGEGVGHYLPDSVEVEEDFPADVGERLLLARRTRALTQKEVADYANVSVRMVSGVEHGKRPRDPTVIPRIADVVGARLTQLSPSPVELKQANQRWHRERRRRDRERRNRENA